MRKQIALALFTGLLLSSAGTTQAGDSNHGYRSGYPGGYGGNYYGNGRGFDDRYNRHDSRRGGHDHDNFGRGLAIVAGAVVLGTIIHAVSHNASHPVNGPYQAPLPDQNNRYGTPEPGQDYWYRVDQNGECVLVRLNQQGREVWANADPSYCN